MRLSWQDLCCSTILAEGLTKSSNVVYYDHIKWKRINMKNRRFFIIVLVLIVLGAAGYGAFYVMEQKKAALEQLHVQLAEQHVEEGVRYAGKTQLSEAIASYRKAIEYAPNHALAYQYLGYAHLRRAQINKTSNTQDKRKAVEYLQKSVELDPEDPWAHYNLSLAYWESNSREQAIKSIGRVVSLDPAMKTTISSDNQFKSYHTEEEFMKIVYNTVPKNTPKEGNRELRLQNTKMTGDDVELVQQALFALGYNLAIDGIFGAGTAEAVRHFQKANGMKATGSVNSTDKYKLLLMAEERISSYDRANPGKSRSKGIAVDSANWGVDVLKLGVKGYELQNMDMDELLYTLNDDEYMESIHRDTEDLFESNDKMVEHVENLTDAVDDSVENLESIAEKTGELMDGLKGWFDN